MIEQGGKIVRLVKNGKKGLVHALFSRLGIIVVLMAIQAFFLIGLIQWFADLIPHALGGSILLSILIVLYIVNTDIDPTAKITWLIIIMPFPIFGALLYLYTKSDIGHRMLKGRTNSLNNRMKDAIPQSQEVLEQFKEEAPGAASLAKYIKSSGCFPVYDNTKITYFPVGEDMFEEILRQLEEAKEYIFIEYFIIGEGYMWGRILEALERKAALGVDVRVMYDGTCEFGTLPRDYPKRLNKVGIKCKVFASAAPIISTHYNYRDHRKILVIDGRVAFNGGINLADEYINHIVRFGHWKDTAVMLQGDAVKSFTLMFLQMWYVDEKEVSFEQYLRDRPDHKTQAEGFVIPYGDSPLDDDKVGERVYIDIVNRANKYVHIMSPYLILDNEMENCLKFAAKRGVEVSLILPGIPDKILPYSLARTHYASLLEAGVKIYEYMPGFVHAKVFVSDDREAVVGTINLDYRSFYHHFECATYMYGVKCIVNIEDDICNTIEQSRAVQKDMIWKGHHMMKAAGFVLKAIAPLL